MSQVLSTHPSSQPAHSVYRNCLTALLRPSTATYKALGEQRVGIWHTYLLMFAGSLIASVISSLAPFGSELVAQGSFDALLLAMIPVAALISACVLAAFAWCAQMIARILKGSGAHEQLAYVLSAISVPLLIVASIVDQIPSARKFLLVLYFYWLAQYLLAIRAVNGLAWPRAIAATFLALLLLGLVWLGTAFLVGASGILLP